MASWPTKSPTMSASSPCATLGGSAATTCAVSAFGWMFRSSGTTTCFGPSTTGLLILFRKAMGDVRLLNPITGQAPNSRPSAAFIRAISEDPSRATLPSWTTSTIFLRYFCRRYVDQDARLRQVGGPAVDHF
ncbi:hypothetical protein PR202_gb06345 [Eleusine coracana subsp. coracana]|uniref:Secreted protein n=1 Tax=Eleusine coracana subsp. coracana TaxID=191504 RepID=A0AAV5E9F3_ELECO|nr:hypothetical protein PR202_gb06345 [Eleusine coracana subsp. coracana]